MRYRLFHHLSTSFRNLGGTALRVVVTSLVFTVGVVMLLRYLGVPMPSAHELLRGFEGLPRKILS